MIRSCDCRGVVDEPCRHGFADGTLPDLSRLQSRLQQQGDPRRQWPPINDHDVACTHRGVSQAESAENVMIVGGQRAAKG
jgi:hypothetical protein